MTTPPSVPGRFGPDAARRLMARLAVEISVVVAVGVAALGFAFSFYRDADVQGIRTVRAMAVVLVVLGFALGTVLIKRAGEPALEWIRSGRPGEPAPAAAQRALVNHPRVHSGIIATMWGIGGLVFAMTLAAQVDDEKRTAFVTSIVTIAGVGLAVTAVSFLAIERALRPLFPQFFAGEDPSRFATAANRMRNRLLAGFVVASAVPLLGVAGLVSQRLDEPDGIGSLELLVWLLAGSAVVIGTLLSLANQKTIAEPLERLRAAADLVREGQLDVTVPVESADEVGALAVTFNAMVDGLRERRRLEDLFGRHVGPAVVDRALAEGVDLGGERREVTTMFVDLVGFTALSEREDPERVVSWLNQVFTIVVEEVSGTDGFVNKFVGDAAMVVFGAPLQDPHHAVRALRTAQSTARRLMAEVEIGFGIGIASGLVVAGNVGAESRLEYTVIGDSVNQAARLEVLTRDHGVPVLVAGSTVGLARADPEGGSICADLEAMGDLVLQGKTSSTSVYRLRV